MCVCVCAGRVEGNVSIFDMSMIQKELTDYFQYVGLSQITLPYVGPLCKLYDATEGMAIADVDAQIMEDAEENYGLQG